MGLIGIGRHDATETGGMGCLEVHAVETITEVNLEQVGRAVGGVGMAKAMEERRWKGTL